MSHVRWYVWIERAGQWRREGPFPDGFAEHYATSRRHAGAYALEAA